MDPLVQIGMAWETDATRRDGGGADGGGAEPAEPAGSQEREVESVEAGMIHILYNMIICIEF